MAVFDGFRPLCPVIVFDALDENEEHQMYTIHCQNLKVDVECYVSTAIISMKGHWKNQTEKTKKYLKIDKRYSWIVFDTNRKKKSKKLKIQQMENQTKGKNGENITPSGANPYEQYIPDLFRLPFTGVSAGESIYLECQYLQTLEYYKKGYGLLIPLYFPKGTIAEDGKWEEVVTVRCKINALSSNTKVHVYSHEVDIKTLEDGSIIVQTLGCNPIAEGAQDDHPMFSGNVKFLTALKKKDRMKKKLQ
ncbi:hypothetical protein RFI_07875 [Reticulomyxa filosa]|uniref:Uncharacterized protein n=1 Tax=Reticulomyxa filosa TaxID=46433 RepID=X6NVE2_RETFI|nr:hypothetical protein RFI_07875 [Reticulomyxa filosa]|eukprot:ETO29252.1 hypothetical protein RFI_07875 [Reticulomyxa filosa]